MTTPTILIAAPRSGSGKTTVTLGLLAAMKRRGVRVRAAKAGPDYIDPAFHAAATGEPGVNLDSWAMPPAMLDALMAEATSEAEMLVIEGAMGLFDGVAAEEGRSGAAADLAARYGLPVILVLDVSGQAQSAAAVVRGFATHHPHVHVKGVVLNRVASPRHRAGVEEAMAALDIPVVGAIPRDEALTLPERHLGLVQAGEHPDLSAALARLADMAERCLDVGRIVGLAQPQRHCEDQALRSQPSLRGALGDEAIQGTSHYKGRAVLDCFAMLAMTAESEVPQPPPPGQRIALARDAAFSFIYPHILAGWRRAGAEVIPFSPLNDECPPEACDACWLPGGYPELHAGKLTAASHFREGLRHFAKTRPVHGECGGYMVLGAALEDAQGVMHPMTGLLSHVTSFAKRRLHLGYRRACLLENSILGLKGTCLRGHEFHYASILDAGHDGPLAAMSDAQGNDFGTSGGRRGCVTGSFFHIVALE